MKNSLILCIFFLLFVLHGCKNEIANPTGSYSVSGVLMSGGKSLPNATVSLDNRIDLTSQSNSNGYFCIENVSEGDYTLNVVKTNTDGSYITKTTDISVTDDIYLASLILPKGVCLLDPTDITATSVQIAWNATDANDFREYKLYRHTTSGLDETTGTLAHVSTVINDTVFIDENLNNLTTYYYRVYIMNQFGKLGGSNIVSGKTLSENIVQNGNFETISGSFADYWYSYGEGDRFYIDSFISYNGNNSVRIELLLDDWGVQSWGLYYKLISEKIEQGKIYNVSFWCKSDSLERYESISCFLRQDNWYGEAVASLWDFIEGPQSPSDWKEYSFSFSIPVSYSQSNYYLHFTITRAGTAGYNFNLPMTSWIDNVVIEKQE